MENQKQLLRAGIAHLIMGFKGHPLSQIKLQKLGKSHSQNQLDIPPSLYKIWLSCLLKTIAKHDPDYNSEVEAAWKEVMNKGIETMAAHY